MLWLCSIGIHVWRKLPFDPKAKVTHRCVRCGLERWIKRAY